MPRVLLFSLVLLLVSVQIAFGLGKFDVVDYANAAVKAQENGDLNRAFELYTEIIKSKELKKGDALLTFIYNNRGLIWADRGDLDKAIEDYTRAIENLPDEKSFINRGNAWIDKGEDDKAIEDYTRAITKKPNYARAYNYRGYARMNKGEVELAKKDFQRARSLDPGVDNVWRDRTNLTVTRIPE